MNCACKNQLEEIIECRGRGDMRIDKMLRRRDRLREGTCLAREGHRQSQVYPRLRSRTRTTHSCSHPGTTYFLLELFTE